MKLFLVAAIFALVGLLTASNIQRDDAGNLTGVACEACKLFADEVKKMIDTNIPEDKIKADAEKLCERLPEILVNFCKEQLVSEIHKIYTSIDNESPEDVCKSINMC